jgi:translation elongation factor EF-1alpha
VLGATGAGKSTLLGRLLHELGAPAAAELTPETFHTISDKAKEEIANQKTIRNHIHHHETESETISFVDTPGDAKYIKTALRGAAIGDFGLIVVSANDAQSLQGQNACFLHWAAGNQLTKVVICINKIDAVENGHEVFYGIQSTV